MDTQNVWLTGNHHPAAINVWRGKSVDAHGCYLYPWHGIVGWAYDADTHCNDCALGRFGEAALFADDTTDGEGNPVHPIFSWSEHDNDGKEYCGDCHEQFA